MPIKKVLIKHILRKGFFGKGLEHYLKNRLRSVSLAVPKIDHGKIGSHKISQNIVDCEVSRFCAIFYRILISQNIICFGKYCQKIPWKYLIQKIGFYLKIFLSFWKILVAKGVWVEKVLEKFSTRLRIELGKSFLFLFKEVLHVQLEMECVTNRFYFLKPQAFFS